MTTPSPWDVDANRLPPDAPAEVLARFALNYAVLAPSSHNSQPWRFIVDGTTIILCADRTRALPVVDPFDREMVISCGAALFNLRVALSHFKLGYAITLCPAGADPDVLAFVKVLPGARCDPVVASLFDAIPKRVTTRMKFRSELVAPETQERLLHAADAEGVEAVCIDDLRGRERIGELIAEADRLQFHDPRFRSELASWIHSRRAADGMSAYAPEASKLLDFAVPLTTSAIRTFDLGSGLAAAHKFLADGSPVLICLGTATDDRHAWLSAGQALERVLLTGVNAGLTASYLNQPVEVDPLRDALALVTGMTAYSQLLLRMGRGPQVPHSPRRALTEVVS